MVKYVLTGVGGQLGGHAADYAVAHKRPDDTLVLTSSNVSALAASRVAAWTQKGATVAQADYNDVDSLARVFQDAAAIAFVSTWLIGDRRRGQMANCIAAAKAAGVQRVCYTSFVGAGSAHPNDELPFLPRDHQFTEQLIVASGLAYNIQRNWLYQDNTPRFFARAWPFTGDQWLSNSHNVPGAYVATEDCGRVFGALLLGKQTENTVVSVTGPEAVTDRQVFDWMNALSGYNGQFVDMPDAELRAYWLERGLPTDADGDFAHLPVKLCVDDLLCCGETLANGSMSDVTDTVERLTGRKPLSFKQNLLQYRDLFPMNGTSASK